MHPMVVGVKMLLGPESFVARATPVLRKKGAGEWPLAFGEVGSGLGLEMRFPQVRFITHWTGEWPLRVTRHTLSGTDNHSSFLKNTATSPL